MPTDWWSMGRMSTTSRHPLDVGGKRKTRRKIRAEAGSRSDHPYHSCTKEQLLQAIQNGKQNGYTGVESVTDYDKLPSTLNSRSLTTHSPSNPRTMLAEIREHAPPPGPINGCRDCKHRVGTQCGFPSFGDYKLDVFTGKSHRVHLPSCTTIRSTNGACGPEGRLWEKVTLERNYRTHLVISGTTALAGGFLAFVNIWALLLLIVSAGTLIAAVNLGTQDD